MNPLWAQGHSPALCSGGYHGKTKRVGVLGLAVLKSQDRQRDSPILAERPARSWGSPGRGLGITPERTGKGAWPEGTGRWQGSGVGGDGLWVQGDAWAWAGGGGLQGRLTSGPVSVRPTSTSLASCRKPRPRQPWCWSIWRPGRSDGRGRDRVDSAALGVAPPAWEPPDTVPVGPRVGWAVKGLLGVESPPHHLQLLVKS